MDIFLQNFPDPSSRGMVYKEGVPSTSGQTTSSPSVNNYAWQSAPTATTSKMDSHNVTKMFGVYNQTSSTLVRQRKNGPQDKQKPKSVSAKPKSVSAKPKSVSAKRSEKQKTIKPSSLKRHVAPIPRADGPAQPTLFVDCNTRMSTKENNVLSEPAQHDPYESKDDSGSARRNITASSSSTSDKRIGDFFMAMPLKKAKMYDKLINDAVTEEVAPNMCKSNGIPECGGSNALDRRRLEEATESTGAHQASTSGRGVYNKKKKGATEEEKVYRSDREFVKRNSHRKMIWFLRQVGVRHAAGIRNHLEKVKHQEFELPNLQCVYPHAGLAVAYDDKDDEFSGGKHTRKRRASSEGGTHMTYYQMYCPTTALVERVKRTIGARAGNDEEYNKRVLTFIAGIVGRLLWHNNRTHAVMFAKSNHLDRECFLLYSRTTEPPPSFMWSDTYFCRRHDTEKFKNIVPQPDLTRANSARVSNESCVYVVGCNASEICETFPYDYRVTWCRRMKPIYERLKMIDPALVEHEFSPINNYVNYYLDHQPVFIEEASRPTSDILSVFLRESELKDTAFDDSLAYRNYVERFLMLCVINVHCLVRLESEMPPLIGRRPSELLDSIVLHNVGYRREVRELRTNRVYYYRNASNFVCSLSLLDDLHENGSVEPAADAPYRKRVYFYNVLQPFEYDNPDSLNVNELVFQEWDEVQTLIEESSHTIHQLLTPEVLSNPPTNDPFYPPSDMTQNDIAIDSLLEKVIKHSKKVKIPATSEATPGSDMSADNTTDPAYNCARQANSLDEAAQQINKDVLAHALSMRGENRLQDFGFTSPKRPVVKTVHVQHEGAQLTYKLSVPTSTSEKQQTRVNFGAKPMVQVEKALVCAYLLDPADQCQIRLLSGQQITDSADPGYVRLNVSDRILRVFTIKAIGANEYVVKPYVYVILRNMPTCQGPDESLIRSIMRTAQMYDTTTQGDVFTGASMLPLPGQDYIAINGNAMDYSNAA